MFPYFSAVFHSQAKLNLPHSDWPVTSINMFLTLKLHV